MLQLIRIWNRIRRGALYAMLMLLFLLLQDAVFIHVAPFGVRALFMPALVVAVGLFEGGWRGGIFGLAAGFFADLSGTSIHVLFTVLYPLMGFTMGFLAEFLLNQHFYVYLIGAITALFLSAFCQMFRLLVTYPDVTWALWKTCILQTLWSIPFLFPAYYACKALPRRLG